MHTAPRSGKRNQLGELAATIKEMNYMELALGTRSRSGGQFDIGKRCIRLLLRMVIRNRFGTRFPERSTPAAAHWRENYDLGHILRRDWSKIGQKLAGKLHIYVGEGDNYFLNDAVYLVEDFLKTTKNPHSAGEVDYEPRAEHCWNGDHTRPNAISRLRYHQF